jgi:hypothetical protein
MPKRAQHPLACRRQPPPGHHRKRLPPTLHPPPCAVAQNYKARRPPARPPSSLLQFSHVRLKTRNNGRAADSEGHPEGPLRLGDLHRHPPGPCLRHRPVVFPVRRPRRAPAARARQPRRWLGGARACGRSPRRPLHGRRGQRPGPGAAAAARHAPPVPPPRPLAAGAAPQRRIARLPAARRTPDCGRSPPAGGPRAAARAHRGRALARPGPA